MLVKGATSSWWNLRVPFTISDGGEIDYPLISIPNCIWYKHYTIEYFPENNS